MVVPDNITRLYDGEETLRQESLRRIAEMPGLAAHLVMIEQSMNLLQALLPSTKVKNEDQLVLGNLGIRCFNALASCLKLALSGYYQASALHIRDLLETAFLLDYFSTDAALVTRWRTMSDRERKKAFSPFAVRDALDKRDGFTGMKRKAAYEQLSKLAGHATPEGAIMLVPDPSASAVHCGPFLEITALMAVLSEAALTAVQVAGSFRIVMDTKGSEAIGARASFLRAQTAWLKRFFDRTVKS
ncbi:hypothetical protein [Sphingomonas bacterium]|uniref:hypothetical protein n=1 Tax=Sphingomonas bacterium TaxID=1895847 RepID=UPI00262AD272|nr:hypothetical protein [Sphingomonas bacterium]MDB5678993.1 uncharacterized protein [Sphingomonas bacterium]